MNSCALAARHAASSSTCVALGLGDAQVVGDAAIEEVRVLRDDRHLPAQHVQRQLAQVVTVEQHPPLLRIDEAQQQIDERRLARAARPTTPERLTGSRARTSSPATAGRRPPW